jgi:hypothetical protein
VSIPVMQDFQQVMEVLVFVLLIRHLLQTMIAAVQQH